MQHTLANYNGVQIVTPADDLSADRQALNGNFKTLADFVEVGVQNPMTSNLDGGEKDITNIGTSGDNPALAVNSEAITSLDGGKIVTDGFGDLVIASNGENPTPTPTLTVYGGFNPSQPALAVNGFGSGTSLDTNTITTDSYGDLRNCRVLINRFEEDDDVSSLQVGGQTSLDSGQITTDGLGTLCLHPQSTPPTAVAGGIYFDGTNFNFCSDGSTWVSLTLP